MQGRKSSVPLPEDYIKGAVKNSLGFPGGSDSKESTCKVGDFYSIPGSGRCLEKGMATHTSTLGWRIPWTEVLGGLQSIGVAKSQTQLSDYVHRHADHGSYL